MDDDLLVPLLPKLAATPVTISRQHMLQLSVNALGITACQSVYHDEDDNGFFASVEIQVPPHENIPQFKTTIFAGHSYETTGAALESASTVALHYMQKAGILIINDLNFPEVQKCKKELVRARFWADIFEHETVKLKKKLIAYKEKCQVLNRAILFKCRFNKPRQIKSKASRMHRRYQHPRSSTNALNFLTLQRRPNKTTQAMTPSYQQQLQLINHGS